MTHSMSEKRTAFLEKMKGMFYNEKHDCYYNQKTGQWLEPKCSDPECEFCADRPETYQAVVGVIGQAGETNL